MIFSSLVFLCFFLPVVYILYILSPSLRVKNGLLLVASLLFYAYGEPIYVLLMVFSAFMNYLCARLAAGYSYKKRKLCLAAGIAVNLGILAVFKYASFLVGTCCRVLGMDLSIPRIPLPIGISFFTFQALSYVIDVYRGEVEPQTSFPKVLLYISFFPQLIAGPIIKYKDIYEELENRSQSGYETAMGLRRFICGLAKKLLVANTMGQAADQIFAAGPSQVNALAAWLGAAAYMFQIYYDFSGYSDMAIGLGRMFGFHFKENFLYPYAAASIRDFWRRWHISLSTWFKDYLYIPLGGNRKGRARTCVNKIIVFFFTGLWHGANWTFVLWGLYHGFFLLLEEYIPAIKKLPRFLAHIYTLLVVCVGFVMFRADTPAQGMYLIGQMFIGFSPSAAAESLVWQQLTPWFLVMLVAAVLGAAPVRPITERLRKLQGAGYGTLTPGQKAIRAGMYALSVLLLVWCIVRMSGGGYNPFIYFRF